MWMRGQAAPEQQPLLETYYFEYSARPSRQESACLHINSSNETLTRHGDATGIKYGRKYGWSLYYLVESWGLLPSSTGDCLAAAGFFWCWLPAFLSPACPSPPLSLSRNYAYAAWALDPDYLNDRAHCPLSLTSSPSTSTAAATQPQQQMNLAHWPPVAYMRDKFRPQFFTDHALLLVVGSCGASMLLALLHLVLLQAGASCLVYMTVALQVLLPFGLGVLAFSKGEPSLPVAHATHLPAAPSTHCPPPRSP